MKTGKTTLTALILAAVLIFTVTAALATSSKPQETEPPVGSLLDNPDKPTTEVKVITSYVDRMDGKTYYSDDNGQTWHEGDAFLQTGYDFDSVDWWTAEEYEAYLEQMKTEFQSMIGERSWNPTEGWYTWDQARVDAAIAGNEQLLQEIRDGKLVSKPTADGDTMIQFSYDPRAIGHLTEASGAVAHASVESPSQEEILAEYAPFGITFDGSTMRYHGELVDVFVDGVELDSGGWALRYSHTDYRNGLRLVTVRSRKDNGDGSFDPFGVLTGIRALQDEELKGLGLSRYAAPAQEATALTTDSASEDGGVDFRDAFNAKFKPYGVSFVPSGTFGNIYWNGKLVHVFVDDMPDGTYQTISSIDGGTVSLKAVYDASGNLNGVVETAEGVSLS